MDVALLDADAVIRLLEAASGQGNAALRKVLDHLASRFHELWISRTVHLEVRSLQQDERTRKANPHCRSMDKVIRQVARLGIVALRRCPVPVGRHEIALQLSPTLHAGEVDSVLQARKLVSTDRYQAPIRRVTFVSGDLDAIEWAERLDVDVLVLDEIINEMKQLGLALR
jgi:hypothetical protein